MIKWHLEQRKISELKNWEKNPRTISEKAFKELEKSVDALGNFEPLVINIDGTVIAGNQRLRLEMKKGNNEVDVYVPERELSEEEIKKIGVISNRHSGEWDMDILANEFEDILKELNFDDLLPEVVMEVSEDNYEEPEQLPSKVQLGEVWQLGKHRLMCGDSTKIEDVERLMNGQKADMVFTDPPYGMDLDTDYTKIRPDTEASRKFQQAKGKTTNKKYSPVIGDDEEWIFDKADHLDCDEQFWWGADWYRRTLPSGGSWFVWDKRTNDDGSNLDSMFGSVFELCWSKTRHKREIARIKYASLFGTEREDIKKRLHPTQKPILLCSWFIERFSKEGWNIVDLFGGSGSTLIACEQTDRICYMMELDTHYCDVIIDRWEKLTGQVATKL